MEASCAEMPTWDGKELLTNGIVSESLPQKKGSNRKKHYFFKRTKRSLCKSSCVTFSRRMAFKCESFVSFLMKH